MEPFRALFPPKYLRPVQAAAAAFFLGPAAMSLMYFRMVATSHPAVRSRGLFDFYSASYGDFILLPIGWALLAVHYRSVRASGDPQSSRRTVVSALLLSVFLTLAIVVGGMYGVQRDWTIPEVGEINFPGIYHGLFMALMLSNFNLYLFDFWRATRESLQAELAVRLSTIYWTVLNLMSLFFVLLWTDRLYQTDRSFLEADPVQQVFWVLFIIWNIWFTIRRGLQPYGRWLSWALFQAAWWMLLTVLGIWLNGG